MTYRDIVQDALSELGVLAAESEVQAADAVFVLGRLNAVLDYLNALELAAYVEEFTIYTGSSTTPHTIGPSTATFTVAVRPEEILAAKMNGADGAIITLRDENWWLTNSAPLATGTPANLYYRPSWPNGELNFYPYPTGAFLFYLVTRQRFVSSGNLDTVFTLPPGYQSLVMKRLAMEIAPAYEKALSPLTMEGARMALATLQSKHAKSHTMTSDVGHPGGYWDFNTSTYR